jgi:integrase
MSASGGNSKMQPITFTQAAEQYLENLELENGRNIPDKKKKLEQQIVPYFGDMPLESINRFEIERFKRHLLAQGLKESTVNRYLAVISQLFHKAVEWDWLVKIPCRVIKYGENNIRTRYLEAQEIERLLEAAAKDECPVIEPFIRIALGTAMRKSEILSIQIENINCARREIFIPKAKCGARMQPMTAGLAAYLENYLKTKTESGQTYLFPAKRSISGYRQEIEKPFYRVVEVAGLDRYEVCRHTLRHTAITHLVQAGVDLPTVQRFSGHKTIQMVFRYSHQSTDHLHWALDKMEDRLKSREIQ